MSELGTDPAAGIQRFAGPGSFDPAAAQSLDKIEHLCYAVIMHHLPASADGGPLLARFLRLGEVLLQPRHSEADLDALNPPFFGLC